MHVYEAVWLCFNVMYACIALFRLVMSCKLVENSASQDPSITFEIIFPGMHVSRPSD